MSFSDYHNLAYWAEDDSDGETMSTDARAEVLAELRTQTALLRLIFVALKPEAAAVNDSVCNGQYGDPIVKQKPPRDWTGDDMRGRQFSDCPPEFLDLLADRFDFFVRKNTAALKDIGSDGDPLDVSKLKKDIKYGALDSARARAWAARKRAGWTAPAQDAAMKASEPKW